MNKKEANVKEKEANVEEKELDVKFELIRKITNKNILGDITVPEKPVTLYTLVGNVYGYEIGNTQYGDFIKFKGDFSATLMSNGQEFRSPCAIIPAPMDMVIANLVDDAALGITETKAKVGCELGISVGVKPANTPTGYEWTVKTLIDVVPTDSLRLLKDKVMLLSNG